MNAPIGVFDSGMGGLTVMRALMEKLPRESFIYLGDTARLPYGTKSADTVRRYAIQASAALVARGVKLLVPELVDRAASHRIDDLEGQSVLNRSHRRVHVGTGGGRRAPL